MAELAVFSLASKVLSTLASPALKKAYEKGCSMWEARDELDKLRATVETIHAVLLDAEKKKDDSAAVRNWIKRLKDVLYDADDLFDEVATDAMFKQQMKGNKHLKEVRVSFSKLNLIASSNSIAQKVKAIRRSLLEISTDMAPFEFVRCEREEAIFSGMRKGQDPGSFVDPKHVYGRDEDKKAILGMLLHDESNDVPVVIAIVGIGGMGKTTLAQLVYNDEEVQKRFEKRWFACISDTSDDREVIGKIFQSIHGGSYSDFTVAQLQFKIRESIRGNKNFLLVLDDVWDEDHGSWQDRMSLLSGGAKGSRIIVTTRSSSVTRAVDAVKTHALNGLSEDDSWNLFKRVAFTAEQENDPRWTDLGREIVKKCANVPLAIKSIGSLLYTKSTMQEWEHFSKEELPKLGTSGPDSIMSVLRLSYDHLHSNLKQCFAYCSLFPKDYRFCKQKLIYVWFAQGYIKSNNETQTVEEVGHSYFMDLLRRSFFQEALEDDFGDITSCKMHDLVHDLAQHVAGEESVMLTTSSNNISVARHVSAGYATYESWATAMSILNANRLRSFLYIHSGPSNRGTLDQQFPNLKLLRTLSLSRLGIENVPSSIGELKHLRYLDISGNRFKNLPGSITKLLNLCMLNISDSGNLEALPNDFRKLINLRHLENRSCFKLKCMPPGFEELTSLQYLDEFKVGGGMSAGQMSNLDALAGLKLRGNLEIRFEDGAVGDSDRVKCWQPPENLQSLRIVNDQGPRIPNWSNGMSLDNLLPNLTKLSLFACIRVKCLPPLRHLPNLKYLCLAAIGELEYMEEEEEGKQSPSVATDSDALLHPHLERLDLLGLPKMKGWWRKVTRNNDKRSSSTSHLLYSFPSLSSLHILFCPKLEFLPLCPSLGSLKLEFVNAKLITQLLSTRDSPSSSSSSLSSLACLDVQCCNELTSLPAGSLTSLSSLNIRNCENLKDVVVPPSHLNNLRALHIQFCPELEFVPLCPSLGSLTLESVNAKLIPQLLSARDSPSSSSSSSSSLSSLACLDVQRCNELTSLPAGSLTSLSSLSIGNCENLKDVVVPPSHLNNLEQLQIEGCPELELWEEKKTGVDWDSLPNLLTLHVDEVPSPERLPNCLRKRQADGNLQISRTRH